MKLYVFADNHYRGYFDGTEFRPKLGFCQSVEHLNEFEVIDIYRFDDEQQGSTAHIPKQYRTDVLERLKQEYIRQFGTENQSSLF